MKIAYIDHAYHQKTNSTRFFYELLESIAPTDLYWDESWQNGQAFDFGPVNEGDYDLVVFFQMLYSPSVLARLRCQKIVLIPMYDSVGDLPLHEWLEYRKYFFVSFSKKVHDDLNKLGISTFYLQYFPDPQRFPTNPGQNLKKVFFWERTADVSLAMVSSWFSQGEGMTFHRHLSPDPGTEIADTDALPSGWTQSRWFSTRVEYLATVASCGVYVAPRRREGIGMSFLEAMATGKVVVGLPYPTLSEYVAHGINGLLVEPGKVVDCAGVDWHALSAAARKSVEEGHSRYLASLNQLKEVLARGNWAEPRLTFQYGVSSAIWGGLNLVRWIERTLKRAKARVVRSFFPSR
jgi:hypothetical protein